MPVSNPICLPVEPQSALSPALTVALQRQAEDILSYLIKTNGTCTYFREAPLLSDFRKALEEDETIRAGSSQSLSANNLLSFTKTVPLSTYEDYRPYIARFLQTPRRLSEVSNLLAPGIPPYVVPSSGTTGGPPKFCLKYIHPPETSSSRIKAARSLHPMMYITTGNYCIIFTLRYFALLDVVDDKDEVVHTSVQCLGSSADFRALHKWEPKNDSEIMKMKVPKTTSPLAVCFISVYRTAILMHGLFALEDRSLQMINALFATSFVDLMRLIEEYWDTLLEAIEHGVIPKLEGLEEVYDHLQASCLMRLYYVQEQWRPNPARAAELRAVGNDTTSPGWAKRLWPNLERILGSGSGSFSRVVPQVRNYAGPHVSFESVVLASTEAWIAQVYNPKGDLNLYKMSADDIFEYLDVTLPETSESLTQAWDVETGKSYELVLTTRDGFWRYRLGDVVKVVGFDPSDGQPITRYSERRNVYMRLTQEFVTEKELLNAMQSVTDTLGDVLEFTVIPDERPLPRTYGFLVELQNELGW
ncbi:hypothetical protein H0H81_010713 [Sphagnurus paluster]|uniref:GH3 middle domain-containing protein n=1 Tax=Sphagnurus paluster TaxID=117069 RepID=A0A9P7GKD4_9AGAR|nr:hypothetical protein H0H81_010713 [Sphagnurus paluster]